MESYNSDNINEQRRLANEIINKDFNLNGLIRRESPALNVPFPNNVFIQKGWECPKCGRVYSPTTPMCLYCSNKRNKTE